MKTKWYLGLIVALIFFLGLIVYAPGAGATDRSGYMLREENTQSYGDIQVKVLHSRSRNVPVNVVVYDQNWKVIASADLLGRAHTFSGLTVGDYHVFAESEESETGLAQDVPVFARQTTQVDVQLERPAIAATKAAAAGGAGSNSCGGVGGDSNLLKVYPSYGVTIIYLQCGHVVGKVEPSGCGCPSGNWRYTTDCPKSAPLYITLPCPRH